MERRDPLKHLIIFCHPDESSLSAAYREELKCLTEDAGHGYIVRDLYNLSFNPVLGREDFAAFAEGNTPEDIRLEQDYIQGADLITFIFPVWWTGMPALMKGYIDRVFARGFAYDIDGLGEVKKLLSGKKVVILSNFGNSYEQYDKAGMLEAMRKTIDTGIFAFCGMEVVEHHFFGHIDNASKEERAAHIKVLPYMYEKLLPPR